MPRYRRSEQFPQEFLVYSQQIGLDQTGQREVVLTMPTLAKARAMQREFYDWRQALRQEHKVRALEQHRATFGEKQAIEMGHDAYASFAAANGIEQVMITVNPDEGGRITFKNRNQATFAIALRQGYSQLGIALGEETPTPRVAAEIVPVGQRG